ncbi:MAG TPA: aldo/keto reductase [Polyangiaceae bacterium]|nr:aldo/keto reductase [Polyangiaceae bacterium]
MRYKMLGQAGLRVSEICLGTMSMGQDWPFGADEATSRRVLDAYADAGGNFLDTANKYHNGQTEEYLGRWLGGRRDRMVVATKYTLAMDHADPNAAGNHRKNLMRSVEGSLRRLRTDHIDLLWVHAYDEDTRYEETMRGLDDLVRLGKVHYIGISDTPAWVVSAAHVTAELRGWSPVVALQVEYNLLARTPERDLLPMAQHYGMAVTAWAPLAGGVLSGKYTRGGDNDSLRKKGNEERGRSSEQGLRVARLVDRIADELGATSSQVAVAWVLSRGYRYVPIVGARKPEQIIDVMGAAELKLPAEARRQLDELTAVDLGFPHEFLRSDHIKDMSKGEVRAKIDFRPRD